MPFKRLFRKLTGRKKPPLERVIDHIKDSEEDVRGLFRRGRKLWQRWRPLLSKP